MSKCVQLPLETFRALCEYFLEEINDDEAQELAKGISKALIAKLKALDRREQYSTYKNTKLSDEERQEARKAYLDKVGIKDDFRWESLEPPK